MALGRRIVSKFLPPELRSDAALERMEGDYTQNRVSDIAIFQQFGKASSFRRH